MHNPNMAATTLILGGARSGKSTFAEKLADAAAQPIYIATAQPDDAEMADRIRCHQERRSPHWQTWEVPLSIAEAIARIDSPDTVVVVDCLTLWVSNLMQAGRDVASESQILVEALASSPCSVILVSNEVGSGIVPVNALARAFRDHMGHLHQLLAAQADNVYLIVAGIPLTVKSPGSHIQPLGVQENRTTVV